MREAVSPTSVTAAEVSRNFGVWQDRASHGPVIVTHHGRPRIALMAIDAYRALSESKSAPPSNDATMRLALLGEHVAGCFVSFDKALRFTHLNSEASVHFGRPASALLGRPIAELFPENYEGPVLAALRRVADGGDEIVMDAPSQIRPDRLLRMRIFAFPDGVASIFRSITHEVQIEHERHERQALFAARDAHGGVAVARLSLRATFEQPEPSLATIVCLPAERLRGTRLTDLLALRERGTAGTEIEAVLSQGVTRRFTSHLLGNGGDEIAVCIALAPIREGFGISGAMMMLTAQDDQRGGGARS